MPMADAIVGELRALGASSWENEPCNSTFPCSIGHFRHVFRDRIQTKKDPKAVEQLNKSKIK